jgi:hypothetical protein
VCIRQQQDPRITGLGISFIDRGEWILAGGNHSNFPLNLSFEESISLFSDSLRSCSSSLWQQYVQPKEAMFGLEWSWTSGSFSMQVECYFQEFSHEMRESGSLVERLVEGLTEFLQYHVAIPISNIHKETFYVSTSPDNELRGGCFTSSRLVWDPNIMFNFS